MDHRWKSTRNYISSSSRDVSIDIRDHIFIPWASLVVQTVKNAYNAGDPRFDPWVGKIPWRREWQSTPVFLPAEFHGQRSLVVYS